jgi:phosphoenolpyruvate-protein kinase (PTS system EI component)
MTAEYIGLGAARGLALAPAWRADRPASVDPASVAGTPDDVRAAFTAVSNELDELAQALQAEGQSQGAEIVAIQALIAQDRELVEGAAAGAGTGTQAGQAIVDAAEAHARSMEQLDVPALRERAGDIRQVARRALLVLAGLPSASTPDGDFVLVMADAGPADVLQHAAGGIVGVVSVRGGANSHTAIVARSLGIPLVVGVAPDALALDDGTPVLVDGDSGIFTVSPGDSETAESRRRMRLVRDRQAAASSERGLPSRTTDGVAIDILCNVSSAVEVELGLKAGASGVGLLRTELTFLHATGWPDEQAHRAALSPVLKELAGRPVTLRLLDFTNDKLPPFLLSNGVVVESLGALLGDPNALQAQIGAALELGRDTLLRLMVPMVSQAREVRRVRTVLSDAAAALGVASPPLGIMVERPEAVDRLEELAAVSDFFSIGTNDLTSAVLRLDRRDIGVDPAMAAHPAVVGPIRQTVEAAARHGIPVSVCGDAAADARTLPLLVGAGVGSLSVSPSLVDEVRHQVRQLNALECAETVEWALTQSAVELVWERVAGTTASRDGAA